MSISEILRRQAEAVKTGSTKVQQAEQLEALAKQLRAEAKQPVKLDFKAVRKAKDEKLDRFAAAMEETKQKEAEQLLLKHGFVKGFSNKEKRESRWGRKDKPGLSIHITGNTYTAMYHQEVKQKESGLSYIGDFLNSIK